MQQCVNSGILVSSISNFDSNIAHSILSKIQTAAEASPKKALINNVSIFRHSHSYDQRRSSLGI